MRLFNAQTGRVEPIPALMLLESFDSDNTPADLLGSWVLLAREAVDR